MAEMTFAELQALANAAAEQGPDMNEAQKGGGGARLLPEGYAFGRLVEYVELGQHAQEFQGKAKDPALEVQIGFALWGQGYQNEDGTPYIVRPYPFAISRNEKARAFLLFKSLNWKGTAKSFGQLLGETFLVKIVHEAKSKTDATLVSRIDLKGFLPPLDPVTRQPYSIQDIPVSEYRLFLWSHPTKAGWDSLFMDGKWDDGRSKNIVQEKIMSALDFQGSPLQQLLFSSGIPALPTAPAAPPAAPAPAMAPTPSPAIPAAPAPLPVAPGVPVAAPLAPLPVAPAAAVVPPSLPPQVLPVPPVAPSAIPAGSPTTFPSNPVAPA